MKKNIESIYPLSPMQQGMLFHTLEQPGSGVYFEQFICTLEGALDLDALQRACQQVVDRHPVLRTAFVWEGPNRQLQVVFRQAALPWQVLDWREAPLTEQAARFETLLQTDREQGFDLDKPPLMRMTLVRLSEERYRFVWSHHHILLDGWSLPIVLREIFAGYETLRQGETLAAEPVRPYKDYIAWLRRQDLEAAENFWRHTLTGFTRPTPLSELFGRRPGATPGKHREWLVHLPQEVSDKLQELARQHRLTLNTLIEGAWAVLLSCYSGARDVVFGVTVSGRPPELDGVEAMVGLFINTLPLRVEVQPEVELIPWLQRLQTQQAEERRYEYSPLAQVQKWSEVKRGTPLFESLFVFENYPLETTFQNVNLSLQIRDVRGAERTNYPLTVVACPPALNMEASTLLLKFSYDVERLPPAAVQRMAGHLQMVLEGMAQGAEVRLGDLPLLTAEELRQFEAWNATARPFAGPERLHELFEQQAARTPEAPAVVEVADWTDAADSATAADRSAVTYAELEAWANGLAAQLRALGVGPEVRVGLCLERSAELIAGMLAVLKAGGTYLPLDPQLPRERLAYLLEDAGPPVVLTCEAHRAQLGDYAGQVLCLDGARATAEATASDVAAANTAYIIYTSGSTGQPKGVAVTHANISNLVQSQIRSFGLREGTRVLQFASLNFDASVSEIFTTLASGGELYLVRTADQLIGETLLAVLQALAIEVVTLPPSLLRVMDGAQLPALQTVISAGEACPWDVVARWGADRRLLNFYGPTEATVGATYELVTPETPQMSTLSIGRPIENVQAYVVDAALRPLPVGVPGELVIGGAGVARGYLHRAGQTAERFVPAPCGAAPGARWYRTGDQARYLEDGRLEFIGRLDQQVKVRGFRVELGEIEAVLGQHPAISEVAVIAQERRAGEVRLVAYFVPAVQPPPTLRDLRRFLQTKLPDYMIPGAFVVLETLPLTTSGKVDRAALPAQERALAGGDTTAPRTALEEQLVEVWAQVLDRERIGIHDNFFELGGDSILCIQTVARAGERGLHFTVQQIFQHPTIADLAAVVSQSRISAEQELVVGPAPLTPIQQWFFAQAQPDAHHFNQAFLFEAAQPLEVKLVEQALAQLLKHHDILRATYVQEGGAWQQSLREPGNAIPLTALDLQGLTEAEQTAAFEQACAEAQRSLDLQTGPLMRFVWLNFGPARPGRVLWVMHHLVVDIVSWRTLIYDFEMAYRQLQQQEALQLPAKTTAYTHWAERLVAHAQTDAVRAELPYWLTASQPPLLALPWDLPAAPEANLEASAGMVQLELSIAETQALLGDVLNVYHVNINEVLLTALAYALGRWLGNGSVLVEMEGHGREDIFPDVDLSRTVGWFTAAYPLRLPLDHSDDMEARLRVMKETARAVPHKGIGYGLLRYLTQDEAAQELAQRPAPEISFNYMGQLDVGNWEGGILSAVYESTGSPTSPQSRRSHLVDFAAAVTGERLLLTLVYSEQVHHQATVQQLADDVIAALRAIVAQSQSPGAKSYTPSDFPAARVSQQDLDRLMSVIGQKGEA